MFPEWQNGGKIRSGTGRNLRSSSGFHILHLGLGGGSVERLLSLKALHGIEAPFLEHLTVLVPSVAVSRKHLLACEDGIGARHETLDLLLLGHGDAAGGQTDDGSGHHDTGRSDGAQDLVERDHLAVAQGRAGDGNQSVNGEGFRVRRQVRDGVQKTNAVRVGFTQTQDTAGADVDARVADVRESLQTLVVGTGGDDGRVELARGVEVVVVGRETSLLQLLGLVLIDHAQRHTHFHAHVPDAGHHLLDVLETGLAPAHVSPCGTHAEPRAAVLLGHPGLLQHLVDGAHLRGLQTRVVAGGLCAVGAVFAAAAGLDVHQGAHLDRRGIVEAAVDGGLWVGRISLDNHSISNLSKCKSSSFVPRGYSRQNKKIAEHNKVSKQLVRTAAYVSWFNGDS